MVCIDTMLSPLEGLQWVYSNVFLKIVSGAYGQRRRNWPEQQHKIRRWKGFQHLSTYFQNLPFFLLSCSETDFPSWPVSSNSRVILSVTIFVGIQPAYVIVLSRRNVFLLKKTSWKKWIGQKRRIHYGYPVYWWAHICRTNFFDQKNERKRVYFTQQDVLEWPRKKATRHSTDKREGGSLGFPHSIISSSPAMQSNACILR